MKPANSSQGLLLLEEVESAEKSTFSWDNATVYFVMTDRFYNGNPDNDNSYGRSKDGQDEVGTFHGGDLAGLTEKLDYIESLGANAIWITSPLEQIHGWVGGGRSCTVARGPPQPVRHADQGGARACFCRAAAGSACRLPASRNGIVLIVVNNFL